MVGWLQLISSILLFVLFQRLREYGKSHGFGLDFTTQSFKLKKPYYGFLATIKFSSHVEFSSRS